MPKATGTPPMPWKDKGCKYYLPCGMCELTKEECKNKNNNNWQFVPVWDTTPIPTTNPYKPMCANSDTFKIHPESGPMYNGVD